jgi:two-component system, sensor histidine kinase and response regulator
VMDSLRSGTQPEQQTRAQLAQSALQSSNALAGVRLLAVDDNALNLSILKGILTKHGAEVVLANNGQEAVDIVAREHERLDLCLMDVQMPVMNGLDACTYIHDELKLPGFPVIALTAGAMLSEHRKAIEAGMSGVLTKPLEVQKVIETVNLFRRQGTS